MFPNIPYDFLVVRILAFLINECRVEQLSLTTALNKNPSSVNKKLSGASPLYLHEVKAILEHLSKSSTSTITAKRLTVSGFFKIVEIIEKSINGGMSYTVVINDVDISTEDRERLDIIIKQHFKGC